MQLYGVDLFGECTERTNKFYNELKIKMDRGLIDGMSVAEALRDGFSCNSNHRCCSECKLKKLRRDFAFGDLCCSDTCGAIVRVLHETRRLRINIFYHFGYCQSCANYTLTGCKEHIDWYPEENDYCSKYKEIEND